MIWAPGVRPERCVASPRWCVMVMPALPNPVQNVGRQRGGLNGAVEQNVVQVGRIGEQFG